MKAKTSKTKRPKSRSNARLMAEISITLYVILVAVLLLYSVFYYQDVLVIMAELVGSGIFGIMQASYLNSYLARDLEKSKKKYEIKTQLYAELHTNIEALRMFVEAHICYDFLMKRIDRKEGPKDSAAHIASDQLFFSFIGAVDELGVHLGETIQLKFFEDISAGSFLGMHHDEFESLPEEEVQKRIKDGVEDKYLELLKLLGRIMSGFNRNISRLFVLGEGEIARHLQVLADSMWPLIGENRSEMMQRFALQKALDASMVRWNETMNRTEYLLLESLDDTL